MSSVPNVLNYTDDPRLLLSEPFRAVHFVYGLFHPELRPLNGRALVGSLTTLGFGEEAVRGILLRLRRGGFLASHRSGREAVYALSPRSAALIAEVARRMTEPPPPWDGAFETLVVHIPPARRAFREQLRRHAEYAGFGAPLSGLLVAPYATSTASLAPLLEAAPSGVRIIHGRLVLPVGDAVVLSEAAWDLAPVAAALRREEVRMLAAAEAAEAGHPRAGAALKALWQAIGPFFEVLSARPPMPSALLPADWPLDGTRAAFVRLAMAVADQARAYVDVLDNGSAASDARWVPGSPALAHEMPVTRSRHPTGGHRSRRGAG